MGLARHPVQRSGAEFAEFVPHWLSLYVFLGLGDLAFTLVAFQCGAIEANPVLYQAQQTGLFEFSKISMTLLVLCTGFWLRKQKVTEIVMAGANTFMIILNVYHISALYLHYAW